MFRSFAGFGSSVTRPNRDGSPQRTGFRANVTRSGTIPATDWAGLADQIPLFAERMAAVVIEQMPALRLIAKYDSTDALLYVDPPYLHSTREPAAGGSYRGYRFEMSDEDHRALILALRGARGMVVVSGHPSRLYDELLDGWQRVEKEHHADGARPRTEVLWINFACSAALSRENAQPSLALEARS